MDITLAAGETKHVDLSFKNLREPGFYKLIANVNNNDVCSYNIGFDPQNAPIKATTPNDFWTYWEEGLKELASTYDLMGRKTLHPGKGIYIVNGKKILVK